MLPKSASVEDSLDYDDQREVAFFVNFTTIVEIDDSLEIDVDALQLDYATTWDLMVRVVALVVINAMELKNDY